MRHILLTLTVLLSSCLLAFTASAQTSLSLGGFITGPDAPVEMTADKLTVSQSDGSAQFEGNVIIAQGVIRLTASLVTVTYLEAGGIDRLNASGGVTLVTQTESAKAETAEYDLTNRQLMMRGEVVLIQGQNAILADSMNIDLASGAAVMEGKVRTVLSSESK
ncbi:LptA/OstA family protein [uncultured Planktomarina sp.]|uniref:LptA/OstA family protein n=1 Tax=uncultured Planktomarina sp. TaxID=1538529 RepID=UPI0032611835